jgi:hypothetical protein
VNLRRIANGLTRAVNGNQTVQWVRSMGYSTDSAGKRQPLPDLTRPLSANVQPLQGKDLQHVDALNMQGVFRSVYLYGDVEAIVRADGKGGDILQFPEVPGGQLRNWLVTQVMETWPSWCRVIVTLQAQ